MLSLIAPIAVLSGIGLVLAALLAVARKLFPVELDERQELISAALPGANCGGCGYPGCGGYAAALVKNHVAPNLCPPGGRAVARAIGRILGVEVAETEPRVAVVACAGDREHAPERATYLGVYSCTAAQAVAGGFKACASGCLGQGSCQVACVFCAIELTGGGLAFVHPERCTGCGTCVATCPRGLIKLVPERQRVHVLCSSPAKAKDVKAVCAVGCTGCKLCVKHAPALVVQGTLAHVDSAAPPPPETIAYTCPQGAIHDARRWPARDWLKGPVARATFEGEAAAWKTAAKQAKANPASALDAGGEP